jgi:N6-L-threonylcarbamoyladenine synthase
LDKSAILLGYTYPGGQIIENLALKGKKTYQLPLPRNKYSCDFSFSGLKSAVRRLIERGNLNIPNLACSLQYTLVQILALKIKNALKKKKITGLALGGGVAANQFFATYLRNFLQKEKKTIELFIPSKEYCTDNAAMVGILAYYKIVTKK